MAAAGILNRLLGGPLVEPISMVAAIVFPVLENFVSRRAIGRILSWVACTLAVMGRGATSQRLMPIIIPRLGNPKSASTDERDEHLMLLEAARHNLDVEWTETLAASITDIVLAAADQSRSAVLEAPGA